MPAGCDAAALHAAASRRGECFYTDPQSGYRVFTERALLERGYCCGSGCRHCPYAHAEVPLGRRAELAKQPAWLTPSPVSADEPFDVLFWSGGKDSWLAYSRLRDAGARRIAWLTSFDAATRVLAHQEIPVRQIVAQAGRVGVPLIGVPLAAGQDYVERIAAGLALLPKITRLAFGDLHLASIRGWREDAFAALLADRGATLEFPIWHADYDELFDELEASGASVEISAVTDPRMAGVRVGDRFDRAFVEVLPAGVDAFGERGEFHTLVTPPADETR